MPHLRQRQVFQKLLKRLKYFRVVAIQGARQTGKSILAREILAQKIAHTRYFTFDLASVATHAKERPQTFLEENSDAKTLIIDEAQKVPGIFDAIKFVVDLDRRPGQFVVLGSTEFSHLTQIRESLTGRMGRVRIFPFNLAESLGHHLTGQPTRQQVLGYLKAGGMPGIFSVREDDAREGLIEDWINLTCRRDIHQIKGIRLDSDLAYQILQQCARLPQPSRPNISRALSTDGRKIETHLKVLCALFVLQKIPPHRSGKGKPIYHLLDPAIAGFLGASFERKLQILVMNERLCKNAYSDQKQKQPFFYRSTGKNLIHWAEESPEGKVIAIQCVAHERIRKVDAFLMKSFLDKNPGAKGYVLAPIAHPMKVEGVSFRPLEEVSKI